MADACYMRMRVAKKDVADFERIGFRKHFDNGDGTVDMEDACARGAHHDDLVSDEFKSKVFTGWHDSGTEYSDGVVACDGKDLAWPDCTSDGMEPVVRCGANGRPLKSELAEAKKYAKVRKNAEWLLAKAG